MTMQRRLFNTALLGVGFSMLDRVQGNQVKITGETAGTLIEAKPIETNLVGARAWRIRYSSKDVNDVAHEVTGIVIAPTKQGGNRPIVTWCHGTTGLGDAACPSTQPDPASELRVYFEPGSTQQIDYGVPGVQGFIDRGYVVCATDYQGLGNSEVHQYMVSRTNARDALYIARTAVQMDVGAGTKLVGFGWSQGGGTAAALAELDDADFGDLDLRGSVLLSPGVTSIGLENPIGTMAAAMTDPKKAPDAHLVMMLWGHAAAYPNLDLADVFTPLGIEVMKQSWQVQPVHHLNDTIARVFRLKGPIFNAHPRNYEAWKGAIMQASAGRVKPRCPLLVCVDAFEGGTVIPVVWQRDYAKAVSELGAKVEVREFPNDDHFSLPFSVRDTVADWIQKAFVE